MVMKLSKTQYGVTTDVNRLAKFCPVIGVQFRLTQATSSGGSAFASELVGAAETAQARVGFLIVGAALEAPAVVAGPNDVATVSEAIEQSMVILALLKTLGHSPKARLVTYRIRKEPDCEQADFL
jgi:hypothetical protein